MSVVIQNPAPRPRRKPRKADELQHFSESPKHHLQINDAKMIDDIRQSIEKSDNSDVIKNNLFEPDVPDKMEKRRRHRRTERNDGQDNPSFEPDVDLKENLKTHQSIRLEEDKPVRRRRRRPKQDEVETKNEELSTPAVNDENNNPESHGDGDVVKPRRRRRKKTKEEEVHEVAEEVKETNVIVDPLMIEDEGKVLNIMIHRTDRLKTDLNVLHPMIRVHIIDASTGKMIIKQNRDRKVTSCNEDVEKVTTILPMMTQPFDFKSRRVTIPAWEEALVFNENANYLIRNPNIIYFFEVLDLNAAYSVDKSYPTHHQSSGFHQIAWAFLRPAGSNGKYNTDHKVRLQLYECGPFGMRGDSLIPNVFHWWQQGFRQTYPSTLYVTVLGIKLNSEISSEFAMRSMFPNQKEGAPNGLIDYHLPGLAFNKQSELTSLQQWSRMPSQMCHIPNVPQINIVSGTDGANVLGFSPDGNWLACGAIENMDNFPVLLYDMTNLSNHYTSIFVGHKRIIHNLAWCHRSELLASASADGTCRVWRIKVQNNQNEAQNETSIPSENKGTDSSTIGNGFGDKRVLCHPCFIYTVAFHPKINKILITAGYDKVIRIWDLSMNKKDMLQQLDGHKGFINSVVFSVDGRSMLSGDSKGEIHVWNIPEFELNNRAIFIDKWILYDKIADQDFKGVIINHLIMHPNGKRLFVQSRDGSIRLIDLKLKTMILKFHGIINSEKNLRCALSPCGSFLFSGSEDCSMGSQVFVWNAQTGDHVALFKELGLLGAISSIDYHPKCHMVAFTAIGNESSILIYTYSAEQAQFEIGCQPTNSNPGSPRLQSKLPNMNYDNLTRLDEVTFKTRNFENDEKNFQTFKQDYEKKSADRISRILNSLNTVTEVDRTLRSANHSMDRNMNSLRSTLNDGYISGPDEKGRLMRSSAKRSAVQSIPMTLNMTSSSKGNFTFKPPPSTKHREQSNKYLGEVVALYDYQAQRSDEISFARGELIKIVFRDGKNWLLGETKDGKQGYLPTNYVAGEEYPPQSPEISKSSFSPEKSSNKTKLKNTDGRIENDSKPSGNMSARSRRRRGSASAEVPPQL